MNSPQIIYEDKNFLAVNKPAGLVVHPKKLSGKGEMENGEPTLTRWLLQNYPEIKNVGDDPINRPGIVHRLDKDTSGILLVPKNQQYFEYLKNLFQTGKIKKQYLAIVRGRVKEANGLIDKPIGIIMGSLKRSVHSKKMLKSAVTEYAVRKIFERDGGAYSLLEVFPKTGRTHQIRVHLASIGYPIAGDKLYGGKKAGELAPRQMLHAESLEFSPQPGRNLKLSASPPEDFLAFLNSLNQQV